jgi:hypothetical protein
MKTLFSRIKTFFIYILGPRKTIQQCLSELAKDAKETGLKQGTRLPVESLKLVWNKEKDTK